MDSESALISASFVAILFEASPGFQPDRPSPPRRDGTYKSSQSSLKRVLVSNTKTKEFLNDLNRFVVAILFEASPGFQLIGDEMGLGKTLEVAILFEASPGFQRKQKERAPTSKRQRVAILFEASPGFQPHGTAGVFGWTHPRDVAILFEASPGFQRGAYRVRRAWRSQPVAILFEASPGFQHV